MRKILLLAGTLFLATQSFAQEPLLRCGTYEHMDRVKQQVGYSEKDAAEDAAYEELMIIADQIGTKEQRGSGTIYVVPIVFHIVHEGGVENISDAQVYDAIRILNEDYNKLNADTTAVVASFQNNIANVGFEFRLAQKDALGNCVSGITRTFSSTTNDGDQGMVDVVNQNLNGSTSTANTRFPRSKYLNVWICKDAAGAAGYTNTPNNWTPSKYDGIWINHSYVGSIGTGSSTRSRALTHEVGHWMNLQHVWGNNNNPGQACGNDNVSDTPETEGWTTCNLNGSVCNPPIIENVQNYMEYSYCSRMFTNGQKTRMITAINNSTAQRNQLWQSANLAAAGVDGNDNLCAAKLSSNRTLICAGETIDFYDNSYHGPTSWSWSFPGAATTSSTDQNPAGIQYDTPGTYSVSLTVNNASGTQSVTQTNYITVLPSTGTPGPVVEGFETVSTLNGGDWFLYNPNNGITWEIYSGAAYSGSKSIRLNNAAQTIDDTDELISKTYDLTALSSITMTFKYAFVNKTTATPTDKIEVYASDDCGATWSLRKILASSTLVTSTATASSWVPSNTTQWKECLVTNISTFNIPNFMFKIVFKGSGGNNVYIDDINIDVAATIGEIDPAAGLTVYPNPTDGDLFVGFNMVSSSDVALELVDLMGKVVYSSFHKQLNGGDQVLKIDASNLAEGMYMVRLKTENSQIVERVMVK